MAHLLTETISILSENGKTLDDVLWWGCKDFKLPLDKMSTLLNIRYDEGFGGQEIASDLILVGTDWWLDRQEYDGSEWWKYKSIPISTTDFESIDSLKVWRLRPLVEMDDDYI